jgi:hypothetical protein
LKYLTNLSDKLGDKCQKSECSYKTKALAAELLYAAFETPKRGSNLQSKQAYEKVKKRVDLDNWAKEK